jgi:N-acyl-phosphatidylethanolamine-hydrolysing phospholipase D
MRHVHVNPEESVAIHKDLRSRRSVGIHWGTFRLTYEPYLEPRTRTREVASAEGLAPDDFQVVQIGQAVEG